VTAGVKATGLTRYRYRLLAHLLLGVSPWVLVVWPTGAYAVSALFWVDVAPLGITTLPGFLAASGGPLPAHLLAWPVATLCYLGALASALAGRWDREDRRLTAGLLALAGVALVRFVGGVSVQRAITAFPLGSGLLLAAAAAEYWFGVLTRR
jgi:uncharacterized protein (TIGR04206 family)